jgi:hypothetical protein
LLGQEAVARVDGLGAGPACRVDYRVDAQVALARRRRTDVDGVVGGTNVSRLAIGIAVHGDGLAADGVAGADDAQRNLATIGNQDATERRLPSQWLTVFAQRHLPGPG